MSNKLKAAKEHNTRLVNDKERLVVKLETIRADVIKDRTDKDATSAALEQCEKSFIRDEATTSELEVARAKLKEKIGKLTDSEHLQQLASDELQKIERDIQESIKHIQARKRIFCTEEQTAISAALNQDPKIRERIMEAYSAKMISSNWGNVIWPNFLASIFSDPSSIEIKEAVAKFNQKHSLDQ